MRRFKRQDSVCQTPASGWTRGAVAGSLLWRPDGPSAMLAAARASGPRAGADAQGLAGPAAAAHAHDVREPFSEARSHGFVAITTVCSLQPS